MNELLQEFVDSRGVSLRIEPEGVLHGVKLLGPVSRNGRRYLPEALTEAAPLYEGAKVNVNHAGSGPLATRDYRDRIGVIRAVEARADGLFGDLHFNPRHALAGQLLWDAEHAPENVGLSHNVQARTRRDGEQTVVEAILHVQSVDLVADPATTQGLFESETTLALESVSVELLRLARPDLVSQLTEPLESELRRLRATRPLSREQHSSEPMVERFDAEAFVRAIT